MLERPGDGLGNDFAALPDVTLFDAVARTANRWFALYIASEVDPLVGTIGTEVER